MLTTLPGETVSTEKSQIFHLAHSVDSHRSELWLWTLIENWAVQVWDISPWAVDQWYPRGPKAIKAIVIALNCPPKLNKKTLLLLTQRTHWSRGMEKSGWYWPESFLPASQLYDTRRYFVGFWELGELSTVSASCEHHEVQNARHGKSCQWEKQ